jgi:hypothetical protein
LQSSPVHSGQSLTDSGSLLCWNGNTEW